MRRSGSSLASMAFLALILILDAASGTLAKRTNVILVGATGNLAKKYLFQAFYDQAQMQEDLHVYPAATKPAHVGQPIIDATLSGNVTCPEAACVKFQERVHSYTQLRNEEHWQGLAERLNRDSNGQPEEGRLVYLSIPPSVYASTAQLVNKYLRPSNGGYLRVIFEKPFGSDFDSAKALAQELSNELAEEEIYRVDHYLGKAGVQAITQFRHANRLQGSQWEDLLSNKHVAHVEVAMMEEEDCAGRTGFYDEYGIVRDVLQNHLTEMVALVAMELPSSDDADAFSASKLQVLSDMVPPDAHHALLGQYERYVDHVRADVAKWGSEEAIAAHDQSKPTRTPTFAAAELLIENARWEGVPFLVLAGKQLNSRQAFVKVVFKNGGQLLFQVQGDGTYIQVTGDLPAFKPPAISGIGQWIFDGKSADDSSRFVLDEQRPAYWVVVDRALAGDRSLFIGTEPLLRSWEVWTPLLREYDSHREVSLHLYSPQHPTATILNDPAKVFRAIEQNKNAVDWTSRNHAHGVHPEL